MDCGATSLVALRRQGLDPGEVAAVFVSHRHVDHFGGLPHLVLDGQFNRRTAPPTVVGPPGIAGWLAEAMEVMFPGSSTVRRRFAVEVVELEPGAGPTAVGAVAARAWQVNHGMTGDPFLGLRLEVAGRTIGYTGDTAWTDALVDVAADMLAHAHEAAFALAHDGLAVDL
ncbi:hypothetical protein GCM10029964_111200 [Kibdelosporangium lantanae]